MLWMNTGDFMAVPVQHELVQYVTVHTLCTLHMNILNTFIKSEKKTKHAHNWTSNYKKERKKIILEKCTHNVLNLSTAKSKTQ